MKHRFIHIGDVHLQSTDQRNAARLRSLDQIIEEGLALDRLAAWLIPGDIFHSRSTVQDRNDLAVRLQRMAAAAPVLVTPGNHDAVGDLDVFAKLAARFPILVVNTPQIVPFVAATNHPVKVFALPWPSRALLVSAGASTEEVYQQGQLALEAMFADFSQQLEDLACQGYLTLMMAHLNIAGAVSSVGQPQIGKAIEATPAMLRAFHCPVLLNHVHLPQQIGGAIYAGSITAQDFGETERKRYVVVTIDGDGGWDYESRPLDTPKLVHIEGELTREWFRCTKLPEDLGSLSGLSSWAGCEVRVRFRFAASERAVLSDAPIRAMFASAARLHLDPIAVPNRALRAPAVAAAKTLPEKVAAWCTENGLVSSVDVLSRLVTLENHEASAVLTQLAQRLDTLEREALREEVPA